MLHRGRSGFGGPPSDGAFTYSSGWRSRRPAPVRRQLAKPKWSAAKSLERFPAKWRPVRVKKTRQNKDLEARFDSIEAEMALVERSEIIPSASRFRGNLMFISSESTNKVAIPRVVRSHELRFGLRHNRGIAPEKRLSIERSSGPNWLTMAWNAIANRLRNWHREREMRKAAATLAELDDRTLRDIGIPHRSEIEEVVRYCRDC